MARATRLKRKGPKRSRRKKRAAWDTPRLRLLLKRDKRSVDKDLSEEEMALLRTHQRANQ